MTLAVNRAVKPQHKQTQTEKIENASKKLKFEKKKKKKKQSRETDLWSKLN